MRRPIVAMGACLGAYLLQPWANALAPTVAAIANVACVAVLFLCVRPLIARPLRQAQRSEPQAEMAVANPQSFLPTGHLLFVTIFVFSIAQGLVITLLGWTEEALVWTSFASAMVFVTFCFLVLKNVSFAEAIGAIQAPEPAVVAVEPQEEGVASDGPESASVSARCDAVAAAFGLTPRESEVFALLAQGRTVGGYPREVGHLAEHGALPYQEHLRQAGGAFPARAYRCGGSLRFRIDLLTRKKLCRVCWLCSVSPVVPQGLNWANGDRWAQLPVCHLCKSGSNTQGCIFWLDLYRLAAHFFLICIGFVL